MSILTKDAAAIVALVCLAGAFQTAVSLFTAKPEPDSQEPQQATAQAQEKSDAVLRQHALNASTPPSVSFAQIFPHR